MRRLLLALTLALAGAHALHADKASAFFADGVREIHINFDDANWYSTLYQAHANDAADPYFPARFQYGDTVIERIGVRFKGSSSFRRSGNKKSFKLDFNAYDDSAKFLGLKKLNLNNGDLEPDFLRSKLFFDFLGKYIAASRTTHVRLYVNDVLQGLFIAVEQPDKTMMENRFGDDEDGNLYEAGESNATMTYLGANASSYQRIYTLKTNEEANDYSGLIKFLDVLNNTATAGLPDALEPICDVDNMLYGIALNILFTNLDSYVGSGSEYLLYQRTDNGQFVHIHWDGNESFGITGDGSPAVSAPARLDPFYLPTGTGMGGPRGGGSTGTVTRPLMQKLWAVDAYKRTYLRMLARMLREGFTSTAMQARIKELADLIRADVYADPNKFFTNSDFETAIATNLRSGQTTIPGLAQFVSERYTYLRSTLDGYAQAGDLRLNELVGVNDGSLKDDAGDADPWLEIHNLGPGTLSLNSYTLTDDQSNPGKWTLPTRTLADGAFLILWLDGEAAEGETHAPFKPQSAGGTLYLYSNGTLVDTVTYPAPAAGRAYVRLGMSGTKWGVTNQPTPSSDNPATAIDDALPTVSVVINELMADNKTTIANPVKAESYDDWFELYNPGSTDVSLAGMYLTDKLSEPTKFRIPENVTIPAGGYLVFWADEETDLGSQHTNFKLSASGETIALFHTDGATLIDSVTFGAQTADVSYGRTPNGGPTWVTLSKATPGAAN